MSSLDAFFRAVLTSTADVPYPLRLRAARWYAQHRDLRDVIRTGTGALSALTAEDAAGLLDVLAAAGSAKRPPNWLLVAILTRDDVSAELADRLLTGETRVSVREEIAARGTSAHVLEILSHDTHAPTQAAIGKNQAATTAQRVRALAALDARAAGTADAADSFALETILARAASSLPIPVRTGLANVARTDELRALLCHRDLPANKALLLTTSYLTPRLATSSGRPLQRALEAASRLATHPSPDVRAALTAAVTCLTDRSETPLPLPLARLQATARGSGLTLLGVADALNGDQRVAGDTLDTLAGLDDAAWTVLERLVDDFTGPLADLLDTVTGVSRPAGP